MALFHIEGTFHYTIEADDEDMARDSEIDLNDCIIQVTYVWEEEIKHD